jgi:biopolymer transport protein ExbD
MSRHRQHEAGEQIVLPITPMLDMSFQLLFFFMVIFNPTDPEVAQTLAMAKEKKPTEDVKKDVMAKDPSKAKDDVTPDIKKKEEKKEEEPELDTDLRLFIEVAGGGKQPILLKDGAVEIKKADTLDDKELEKALKAMVEDRKNKAKEAARKAGKPEGAPDFQSTFDAEFAKQKVRIQTTSDVPWGQVFRAMNKCTEAGFKTVALTSPKDYVPKVPPAKD